jgi:MoaA/NifB/PqqE/SkfB family radical SAM enzyme
MPCLSIFLRPVVRPNGDVELCEPLQIKLGNLYEQNLEEIWHSKKTQELHRKYISCNGCWHDAQRPVDIEVISTLKPFLPCKVMNRFFGEYDWKEIPKIVT